MSLACLSMKVRLAMPNVSAGWLAVATALGVMAVNRLRGA